MCALHAGRGVAASPAFEESHGGFTSPAKSLGLKARLGGTLPHGTGLLGDLARPQLLRVQDLAQRPHTTPQGSPKDTRR